MHRIAWGFELDKKQTWNLGYWVAVFLLLFWMQNIWQAASQADVVPYSEFEKALEEGRVAEVTVNEHTMTGRLKSANGQKTMLVTARVEPALAARLERYNVPYTRVVENTLLKDVFSWVAPTLVFFGLWFFLFRSFADKQGMGGFLSIGKSRAKVYVQTNTGVTLADFTAAVERIVAGLERKSRVLSPKEREAVAFHEMGHALVALAQKGSDPVHKVSIIPRGIGALGYTIQRPTEDRYLMTRPELEQKIAVLLGGRAAEKLVFGVLSTGAADDIAKATDIAREMVTRYGMDEGLGYVAFDPQRPQMLDLPEGVFPRSLPIAQETQRHVDEAIRNIVMTGLDTALAILNTHRTVLERGARALLEKETLDEAAIQAFADELRLAPPQAVISP